MKKFLHSYPNLIIGTFAVLFLGILLGFYLWAVNDIFIQLHLALVTPPAQPIEGFDLADAAKLDLHGLVNETSSAASVIPIAPVAPTPAVGTTTTTTKP
jgi:hypothetical protein